MSGEMRNVCSVRMVAGNRGLNTEVGLQLSIDHSVADRVRAVLGVKDQEISLVAHTHRLNAVCAWARADLPLVADEVS